MYDDDKKIHYAEFRVQIPIKEDTNKNIVEALRKLKERLKIKRSWIVREL